MDLSNFSKAFRDHTQTCRKQCNCGVEYYNPDPCWTFDDGELEELENSEAIAVVYAIGTIVFENNEFADVCDCWHDRSIKIMKFIDSHNDQIANYLNLERQRKIDDANRTTQVIT